jgi:hypothetical protein
MTNKKFAVVGVSTLNGKTKIRFANDSMRIKILLKNGHTDVDMINLPHEMTKAEIAQHLTEIGFGNGNPAVTAAVAYIAKKNPAPKVQDAPVNAEVTVEPEVVA